jgi:hypothetical protein
MSFKFQWKLFLQSIPVIDDKFFVSFYFIEGKDNIQSKKH